MAVSDDDVVRSAAVLIKAHGAAAWIVAATRYRELIAAGDAVGAAVWLRISTIIATHDDMTQSDAVH